MAKTPALKNEAFVKWFRAATPYIHQFGGGTFVIAFGGEVLADGEFQQLTHDINVLVSLEIRVVLVHGTRPQIEEQMRQHGVTPRYVGNRRVTDDKALACVKEANGIVRVEMEALLSMELANSPMWGADIRVSSGNFVTAKPVGVVNGVDFRHTGEVRKIDAEGIRRRLDDHEVVLISPLGFSPTGDVFNCTLEDVATADRDRAAGRQADLPHRDRWARMDAKGRLIPELTVPRGEEARRGQRPARRGRAHLPALRDQGVRAGREARAPHQPPRGRRAADRALHQPRHRHDGGAGVARAHPRGRRSTTCPGSCRSSSRSSSRACWSSASATQLESEIGNFFVLEADGNILGCAALYPFPEEKTAELAALAVNPFYRDGGRGERLLAYAEAKARARGLKSLFVLSTRTTHWFLERGFVEADIARLPERKQSLYNYDRRSKIFVKEL